MQQVYKQLFLTYVYIYIYIYVVIHIRSLIASKRQV